jgi:ribose transport system substrate-binding protein
MIDMHVRPFRLNRLLPTFLLLCLTVWQTGCGGRSSSSGDPSASSSGAVKRVILLTNGDDPFWDAMRTGMEKAAVDFDLASANLKVEMDKNDGTSKGQIDKLKQYAGQTDIAAVAISVTDADNAALARTMTDLDKVGVKVITVDSDINRDKFRSSRFVYLGTDNFVGGQELGRAAKGLRSNGGTFATFYGLSAAANVIERTSGFADGAGASFTKADGLSDNMDLTKAQANVRNALQNHPEIDTLVGIWAYNAHAIVEVVNETGIRDKTKIVVFDAAPKAIQHMSDGMIDAMVVQNPYQMGYLATRLAKAMIKSDTATIQEMFPNINPETGEPTSENGDILTTELRVVVPDAESPLIPEMFNPDTQFFTSEQFNAWLAERSLTGS